MRGAGMNVEHCISKIGCWFQGVAFYQNISETCCSNFLGWQTSWGQLWVWQAHPREEVVKKAACWISPTPQPHPSIPPPNPHPSHPTLFAAESKVRIHVLWTGSLLLKLECCISYWIMMMTNATIKTNTMKKTNTKTQTMIKTNTKTKTKMTKKKKTI